MGNPTVAVIGAGPTGLAALKNLREEGFSVTVFEKRGCVGGIWAYTDDVDTTTALPSTLSNGSKFINAFTDFPVPEELPAYLDQDQACRYIQAYADHFDLNHHVKFKTTVKLIKRDEELERWQVSVSSERGEEISNFDKIVICTGLNMKPCTPHFQGAEKFEGKVIHAQAFKRPEDFEGMRVLVVGLSNTGADTATELVGHAKKVYASHRAGHKLLPRFDEGKPLDFLSPRRMLHIKYALEKYLPSLGGWMMDHFCDQITKKHFVIDPAWRLFPGPSLETHVPLVHDKIVSLLQAGDVVSAHGISHFIDASTVELLDGTKLEVDAVIYCTGYEPDFSLLGPDLDPTKRSNGKIGSGLARLYQNIFPPQHADSVAYMNYARINMGANTIADICSLAIAQVWKGGYALPSEKDMEAEIYKHHAWISELSTENKDAPWHGMVREGRWLEFLDAAAGMGINENLGYGWKAWQFWWKEKELCNLIMAGVSLPYVYRLFEGKRKRWEGAREAIVRVNKEAKKYGSK